MQFRESSTFLSLSKSVHRLPNRALAELIYQATLQRSAWEEGKWLKGSKQHSDRWVFGEFPWLSRLWGSETFDFWRQSIWSSIMCAQMGTVTNYAELYNVKKRRRGPSTTFMLWNSGITDSSAAMKFTENLLMCTIGESFQSGTTRFVSLASNF